MDLRVTDLGTILGVWAHPDDEAYLMAGVMALAADAAQRVACVTATLGDAGETADPQRWPRERLSTIRRAELERSLQVLGVTDHRCLDLPDGGLPEVDPAGPLERLAAAVDELRPDTVVTFGPDGMTGHADHRTVCGWVEVALERAASDAQVLWATKTTGWADAFPQVNGDVFPPGLPPQTPPSEAWVLDLEDDTLERKVQALEAHASQTLGLRNALGRETYAEWVRLEAFQPHPAR